MGCWVGSNSGDKKEPIQVDVERSLIGSWRRALTLVELLVVFAIIGILVALLLPAVQATRAAARRTSCKNNLKQLALGLHHYESARKRLPCSSRDSEWISESGEWSWGSRVLPFIEQAAVYERCDFDLWPAEEPNDEVIQTAVPTFRCPSEIALRHQSVTVWDGYEDIEIRLPNDSYGINEPLDLLHPDLTECWRFADIKDGLSNTIMLGETTPFAIPGESNTEWYWHVTWACSISGKDGTLIERDFWTTVDCTGITTPKQQDWDFLCSYHENGSHIALCDGSVRFISPSINTETLRRLADPGDGKSVGDF
jgi:type II secretory pathway pseudopilin PulG